MIFAAKHGKVDIAIRAIVFDNKCPKWELSSSV